MPESTNEKPRYWFPAKCYGWGWGLPSTWEGWLVFIASIAILCSSGWLAGGSVAGVIAIAVSTAGAVLGIAYWKGEPPRWRWGQDT